MHGNKLFSASSHIISNSFHKILQEFFIINMYGHGSHTKGSPFEDCQFKQNAKKITVVMLAGSLVKSS